MADIEILKGGDSPKPEVKKPVAPDVVGGGGNLVDKVKEFHEKAQFRGSPMDKKG